ncbi:hypothetical protein SAMN04488134_103215 [Amphibacillus marinus]|uniref:ABC-2 type transport system permease protein n=1 Tax=Amphibacillus marinus TaxID=872970 RepID=A0A1H8LHN1_9BACI|nr:hypothetical protein [Amphibacillus marinus]SEO04702.1 hypothetical protein SAMN04488134_103215 [Amphibacillus marinus]
MNEVFTLKILDRFKSLFKLLKVDYASLRLIIKFKLMMDQRRVPTILQDGNRRAKPMISPFVKSLLIYALYGLFIIPFLVMGEQYLFQMSIVFAMMMFILITSMISDFSSVLLDVRDKVVLDTKPVDARTLSIAKATHIVIYMTQLTGAFLAIPFVVSSLVNGLVFSLLFLIAIILISIFCIVSTALFYMIVLKYFDGEKLKSFINAIQIFLTIGLAVGYQLFVQMFNFVDFNYTINWSWWHLFLPPLWFSAPFEMILIEQYTGEFILATIIAVTLPSVLLAIYIKFIPTFERNLQKLMSSSSIRKPKKDRLSNWLAKLVSRNKQEQAMFGLARSMLRHEREFKLKVYPSLGLSAVFPIFFLIYFESMLETGSYQYGYLYGYFAVLMVPQVVYMLKYSSKAKGSWIYRVVPVKDVKLYYRATLKAFIIQLYLPIVLLITLVNVYLTGPSVLIHFAVILLTGSLFMVICYLTINQERYPFSVPFTLMETANTVNMFLALLIAGAMGIAHFLISMVPFGVYGYVVLLIVIHYYVWKKTL